jgi:uncharacterized protein
MHGSIDMRITHLWRYPVKSLAGEALKEADLAAGGIPFDRAFRFIDESRDGKALTARQQPRMLAFKAFASGGSVHAIAPDGAVLRAGEPLEAALRTAFPQPLHIEAAQPGAYPFFDDSDLLVINAASVRALADEMGVPVNIVRFRPSVVIDGEDATPFCEDGWVGQRFAAGTAAIEITQRNIRCVFTNIDPETYAVDPSFLKHIAERHEQCFGVYARVVRPGRIAVGDEWRAIEAGTPAPGG